MAQLPVVGFNSAKYDIPLIKPYLIRSLTVPSIDGKPQAVSVIKKGNSYVKIGCRDLLFLDACSYAAPGFSYSKFLAAYDVTETKSFFPYEYVTGLQVLNEDRLPPYDAFYSTLKGANTLEENRGATRGAENYADLKKVWDAKGMKTVRDLLTYYNNCDVGPFLTALENQVAVYNAMGLDMLKDAVTLPGLSLRYSMKDLGGVFYTLGGPTADLAALIRKQVVGGPAIAFHRFAEAGTTKIRPERYGEDSAKPCKSVIGYDCNSLYPFSMAQPMPAGPCTVRVGPDFEPSRQDTGPRHSTTALEWLEFVAHQSGYRVQHVANGPEVSLGDVKVDGFVHETQTAYQFHGCFHHGHDCPDGHRNDGTREERLRQTRNAEEYVRRHCDVELIVKWECEWTSEKKGSNRAAVDFVKERAALRSPGRSQLPARMTDSHKTILRAVESGQLFGMVQVDIHVPDELKSRFEDMPPIFKTTEVGREDIGDYMKRHCEKLGILKKPSRMLISSYRAEGMLFITPLLRWYLRKGLVVTRIHTVLEWKSERRFEDMMQSVAQLRRDADVDPKKAVTGNSAKLLANSAYGKLCEDKAKFRRIKYVRSGEVHRQVTSPYFCDLKPVREVLTAAECRLEHGRDVRERQEDLQALEDEVIEDEQDDDEDDLYEITLVPKVIHMDMPVQIPFFVYQHAKLRMLEFTYDVLDKYLCPTKWRPMYMDTDSMYIACAETSLAAALRPETKTEFYREVFHKWFPAESCELHTEAFVRAMTSSSSWNGTGVCCVARNKFDLRTPGLFKEEWRGSGMVALCAKTYFCKGDEDSDDKLSCKGLQRTRNAVTYEQYKRVLRTGNKEGGTNKGFRVDPKTGRVYTYQQERKSISFLYGKRKVQEDGVTTVPLDL
jgi:G:T-mismatch repair DNA endonuclease (very short patch repair protein)